jgi:hypothetical protein
MVAALVWPPAGHGVAACIQGRHIMSKSKKAKPSKYTFVVLQGITPALKAKYFAAAKRKEQSFSAWAREALSRAVG